MGAPCAPCRRGTRSVDGSRAVSACWRGPVLVRRLGALSMASSAESHLLFSNSRDLRWLRPLLFRAGPRPGTARSLARPPARGTGDTVTWAPRGGGARGPSCLSRHPHSRTLAPAARPPQVPAGLLVREAWQGLVRAASCTGGRWEPCRPPRTRPGGRGCHPRRLLLQVPSQGLAMAASASGPRGTGRGP